MKKITVLAAILVSATSLTACGGGDSDSSGSQHVNPPQWAQESSYELKFASLPKCQVDAVNKVIYAGRYVKDSGYINPISVDITPQECKVKVPDLNEGLTFSLRCNSYTAKYVMISAEKNSLDQIQKTVETGKPYYVSCDK